MVKTGVNNFHTNLHLYFRHRQWVRKLSLRHKNTEIYNKIISIYNNNLKLYCFLQ